MRIYRYAHARMSRSNNGRPVYSDGSALALQRSILYRSLLGQLDYTMDSTLHLRTSFVMWYVLSPLSSASSSSLSFYQWSVQERWRRDIVQSTTGAPCLYSFFFPLHLILVCLIIIIIIFRENHTKLLTFAAR